MQRSSEMTSCCSVGTMSCPVQVENTGASYKIVGNNFEYCPLCCTIKPVYRKTAFTEMLVNCGTVQVQDTMEKLLERINAEQRNILSSATELCHAQITISNVQQAVEESGPSEPSNHLHWHLAVCVLLEIKSKAGQKRTLLALPSKKLCTSIQKNY